MKGERISGTDSVERASGSGAQLHFTIGTGLRFDAAGRYSVQEELAMVKAALLYADGARLCSPGTSLAMQLHGLEKLTTPEERREHVVDHLVMRALTDKHAPVLRKLPKLGMLMRSDQDPYEKARIIRGTLSVHSPTSLYTDEEWEDLAEEMWALGRYWGLDGIVEAVESGLLELHRFEADAGARWVDPNPERIMEKTLEYLDLIASAATSGTTYPLFDDQAGQLVRMLSEEGAAIPTELEEARGKHAALAANLMRRLPNFEAASVKEIFDIRRELKGPLIKFRGAVAGWSEGFRSLGWDPQLLLEAEATFVKEVAPAVEEMREAVEQNRELKSLVSKGARPKELLGGLVAMATMGVFLPPVVAVAVSGFLTAGVIGRNAYEEWHTKQKELQGNRLYFYYGAGTMLEGASGA